MNLKFFVKISCLAFIITFTSCGGGKKGEDNNVEISKDNLTAVDEWLLTETAMFSGDSDEPTMPPSTKFSSETTWKFGKDGKYTKVSNGQTMTTNVKWALKDEVQKDKNGKDYKVLEIITGSITKEIYLEEASSEKIVAKEFINPSKKDYTRYTFKAK